MSKRFRSATVGKIPTVNSFAHRDPLTSDILSRNEDFRFLNRLTTTDGIMDKHLAIQINATLPALYKESHDWHLIYSMDQDGISLNTLFSKSGETGQGSCVLVIKDQNKRVYGAYLSEHLCIKKGFYGNGTSFLWSTNATSFKIFMATGINEFYISSVDTTSFSLGDGKSGPGLFINDDFQVNSAV